MISRDSRKFRETWQVWIYVVWCPLLVSKTVLLARFMELRLDQPTEVQNALMQFCQTRHVSQSQTIKLSVTMMMKEICFATCV